MRKFLVSMFVLYQVFCPTILGNPLFIQNFVKASFGHYQTIHSHEESDLHHQHEDSYERYSSEHQHKHRHSPNSPEHSHAHEHFNEYVKEIFLLNYVVIQLEHYVNADLIFSSYNNQMTPSSYLSSIFRPPIA